ncbi:MAG: FAD:protein FMN transferase [Firmicutes bacterium]|nr:FAD:protein FMN transferase [Bacillota bacterium]
MTKFFLAVLIVVAAVFIIGGCSPGNNSRTSLTRHRGGFFETFDTYVQIAMYTETQEEFDEHFKVFQQAFERYHILFDIFNSYPGVNNIRTINDNAGIVPVVVDSAIIDLLIFSKQAYFYTGGILNIALGPVLSIWHQYRMHNISNPENMVVPSYDALREAASFINIKDLIIDEEAGTVFLAREGMLLDVGATAKAFTVDRVANILRERGVASAVIDAGGDVIAIGESMTGGGRPWNIGIRDPETGGMYDVVQVRDMAAATSGNHYRRFIIDGVPYSHIIDPITLMPAANFAAVSVIHESVTTAEMLSTALFILSLDEGYELAQTFNAAVIWLFDDNTAMFNEIYRKISQNF